MNAVYTKPLTAEKAVEILHAFVSCSQESCPSEDQGVQFSDLASFPVLDTDQALKLLKSKEAVHQTLDLLTSELTKEIVFLKQYHQAKDWSALRDLAHKWRGGSIYCGARRLEEACQQLETYLQTGNLEQAEALYQQLVQAAEATKEAVIKYISS